MLERIPWDKSGLWCVFDYETSGLHPDDGARPSTLGLKWGPAPEQSALVPIDQGVLDKPGVQPTLFGDAPNVSITEWEDVHRWMQQQYLVAHNAKADLWFAWAGLRTAHWQRWDLSEAYTWDTMVVEALLDPGERVSLDLVAGRYGWNTPYRASDERMREWAKKHKHKGQIRYDLAPWDILAPYLQGDLERTWLLYERQQREISEGVIGRELLHRELEMVRTLFRMEQRGLPYRKAESLEAATKALAEMTELERQMPFDPTNRASTGGWFERNGLKISQDPDAHPNAGSGFQGTIDQATVNRAIELGIPGAEQYQRWAKLRTARGLWYLGWATKAGTDGRVRAEYRQVKTWEGNSSSGTVSGRLAVSRVQVQAIPDKRQIPSGYPTMQSLIRPEPGKALYEIDLSQAEMRVAASIAGCTAMLEGFRSGLDAHDSTTRLIWHIEKDNEFWDARRQVAKRLGFGVIYGAGIRTLADQILLFTGEDLGEDGVRELWDLYRAAFPELFKASKRAQRQIETKNWLQLPGGKIRKFQVTESPHKAMNAIIQGGVAATMMEVMNRIELELPGILVGQVHDSVLIEVSDPAKALEVADIMTCTFEEWYPGCPFVANTKDFATK